MNSPTNRQALDPIAPLGVCPLKSLTSLALVIAIDDVDRVHAVRLIPDW